MLPQVPFPGTLPANPITYLGNTYTFANGFLTQIIVNCVNGSVTYRWRMYDYPNAHIITDIEAQLLGVTPEVLVTVPDLWTRAASDAYVLDCVTKNLGCAMVANAWQLQAAAQTTLTQAQQQLANDQQALTAATAAQANLAADQTALTAAQTALAANPADPALQAAAQQAQQQFDADSQVAGSVASLTTAVNTTDPAAITAATTALATIAATITGLETAFA